jgi:oligoribonuclease
MAQRFPAGSGSKVGVNWRPLTPAFHRRFGLSPRLLCDETTMSPDNLIWIDLEMTGLEPQTDRIIEIATLVTDSQLNLIAEGPMLAIHQPDAVLTAMDDWNRKQHGESGLVARVRASRMDERAAELQTLEFLRHHVPADQSPMCGNSICQDRRFLARVMPELEAYFHYRNLDVSTIKELARRWYPGLKSFGKSSTHLALQDIRDSIDELRYYRERLFVAHATVPNPST